MEDSLNTPNENGSDGSSENFSTDGMNGVGLNGDIGNVLPISRPGRESWSKKGGSVRGQNRLA